MKDILKPWLILLSFLLFVFMIITFRSAIHGTSILTLESLSEVHFEFWEYKLGKWYDIYNICKNWEWCLLWQVKWVKQIDENVYILIKSDDYTVFSNWEVLYTMFKHSKLIELNWIDYIPKFWYLSWDEVEFYSENDMENLSEETQKIFRDLELNPKVIVNWKDYTGTRKKKEKEPYSDEASLKCYSCEADFWN